MTWGEYSVYGTIEFGSTIACHGIENEEGMRRKEMVKLMTLKEDFGF